MRFSSLILATAGLGLAAPAPAEDPPADPAVVDRRGITSGTSDGSIFQFGDAARCRRLFYDAGACGLSTYFEGRVPAAGATLVAVPSGVFGRFGEAQDNALCGRTITMTYRGVTRRAVVADENTSGEQSIDMCLDDWKAFGGKDGDGTLRKGIKWTID